MDQELKSSDLIRQSLRCRCPRCGEGKMFQSGLTLSTVTTCPICAFPMAKHDSGDGPAVFLIFILGFLLVPLAIWFEVAYLPPLWVHVVLWGIVGLAICMFTMRPIKSCVIHLQYRHLPETLRDE